MYDCIHLQLLVGNAITCFEGVASVEVTYENIETEATHFW